VNKKNQKNFIHGLPALAYSIPQPRGTFPKPSRFARGVRTRTLATFGTGGTSTTATPGRKTFVSTINIRHNGRKILAACGAATSNSTISGVSSTIRSWPP